VATADIFGYDLSRDLQIEHSHTTDTEGTHEYDLDATQRCTDQSRIHERPPILRHPPRSGRRGGQAGRASDLRDRSASMKRGKTAKAYEKEMGRGAPPPPSAVGRPPSTVTGRGRSRRRDRRLGARVPPSRPMQTTPSTKLCTEVIPCIGHIHSMGDCYLNRPSSHDAN
jgi:hypothetical protein